MGLSVEPELYSQNAMSSLVGRAVGGRAQLLLRVDVDDDHARQRILDVVVVVLGTLEDRVHGDRDGADAYAAEKGGGPAWGVVSDQQDPLLASYAELS